MEVSSCPTLPLSWVPNCPVPNCPVSKCPVPSCPVSSCPGFVCASLASAHSSTPVLITAANEPRSQESGGSGGGLVSPILEGIRHISPTDISPTDNQRTFCQDVQNGHFANLYSPPLDKVDGVEYTYKRFISNYKSVQCGILNSRHFIPGTLFSGKRKQLAKCPFWTSWRNVH